MINVQKEYIKYRFTIDFYLIDFQSLGINAIISDYQADSSCEDGYFQMGKYYDKIMTSMDKKMKAEKRGFIIYLNQVDVLLYLLNV